MKIANTQTTNKSVTALVGQDSFAHENLTATAVDGAHVAYGGDISYEQQYKPLQTDYDALKLSLIDYKQQAHFWKAKHGEAVQREEKLKNDVKKLTAELKKATHKIFGKSSEKKTNKPETL